MIYSKFETMGFPIEADIVAEVKKANAGETTEKVTTSHPPVDLKETRVSTKSVCLFDLEDHFC